MSPFIISIPVPQNLDFLSPSYLDLFSIIVIRIIRTNKKKSVRKKVKIWYVFSFRLFNINKYLLHLYIIYLIGCSSWG